MHAMLGARAFSLAANRASGRVYCGADGVFVGGVPLLQCGRTMRAWSVRPLSELNDELTALYRLPIDIAAKANALALIAHAFDRSDLAMAAIATVQMQLPDPPLAKAAEVQDQIVHRARELRRIGLLKLWDPAEHRRLGGPPNAGWFAPIDTAGYGAPSVQSTSQSGAVQVAMNAPGERKPPGDTSDLPTGGGGGGGTVRLFGPGGLFGEPLPYDGGPDVIRPAPEEPSPAPRLISPTTPSAIQPELPFPEGLPPKLAPYSGGKTSGILQLPDGKTVILQSGYEGPAKGMPSGSSPGFDLITKGHVEGHAAAVMRQEGVSEGSLYINNLKVCTSCTLLLPTMLPKGATLRVILPGGAIQVFKGTGP